MRKNELHLLLRFSPLSEEGIQEIKETVRDERLQHADLIVSSPYTRAMQTAAILSKELGFDLVVEMDLYEWLANKNFIYEEGSVVTEYYQDFIAHQGHYPEGEDRIWESMESMEHPKTGAIVEMKW